MAQIVKLTSTDSLSQWDTFVDQSEQGSIFAKSFWLQAVTKGNFEIITIQNTGRILAGMPLPFSSKKRKQITNPVFTQVLGVLFAESGRGSYEGRLSEQIELTKEIIRVIPRFELFQLNFHYRFTNWTPFYWAGFQQTTRYTYVIQDISTPERVMSEFAPAKRNDIKKASKVVRCDFKWKSEDFYNYHEVCLKNQGETIRYTRSSFNQLSLACQKANAAQVFRAVDEEGNTHAAMYIVYNASSAYMLQTAVDPYYKSTSALSFLIYEAICFLSSRTRAFDFEGSMIPGAEASYRKFGGRQMPIMQITYDRRSIVQKTVAWFKVLVSRILRRFGFVKNVRRQKQ